MERTDSTRRRLVSHRERVVLFETRPLAGERKNWRQRWRKRRERGGGRDGERERERKRERGAAFSFDEIRPSCCELAVWSR